MVFVEYTTEVTPPNFFPQIDFFLKFLMEDANFETSYLE